MAEYSIELRYRGKIDEKVVSFVVLLTLLAVAIFSLGKIAD